MIIIRRLCIGAAIFWQNLYRARTLWVNVRYLFASQMSQPVNYTPRLFRGLVLGVANELSCELAMKHIIALKTLMIWID